MAAAGGSKGAGGASKLIAPLQLPVGRGKAEETTGSKPESVLGGVGLGAGLDFLGGGAGLGLGLGQDLLQEAAEGEDEEGDIDAQAVENMLAQMVAKRKENVNQKQQALLAETAQRLRAAADQLEASIAKEAKDCSTLARNAMSKVESGMDKSIKAMEACTERYQLDMHALWKQYNEQYEQVQQARQEIKNTIEKRRAAAKRKLTALGNEASKTLADTTERMNKFKSKSAKLPGMLQVLQSFMSNE